MPFPAEAMLSDGSTAAMVSAVPIAEEVNGPMIRLWCEMVEDANPLFHDAAFARSRGHRDVVAPPTMLLAWLFEPTWTPAGGPTRPHVRDLADVPGRPNGAVLSIAHTYRRYLELGERPTAVTYYRGPGPETDTPRGRGVVTRSLIVLVDEAGEEAVRHEIATLRFDVLEMDEPAHPGAVTAAAVAPGTALTPGAPAGARGPRLVLPMPVKRFVLAVAATRDFYGIHHDPVFARSTGAPDMFIGIHFMQGLVGRYLGEWAGPDAFVESLQMTPFARNYPGDAIAVDGVVVTDPSEAPTATVDVALTCRNPRTVSHEGRAVLRWPAGAA